MNKALNESELIKQALDAGWYHTMGRVLARPVPWKTRDTFYTWVTRSGSGAMEYVSINHLQLCGKNSRVWRRM